jgi:hypothetical protein
MSLTSVQSQRNLTAMSLVGSNFDLVNARALKLRQQPVRLVTLYTNDKRDLPQTNHLLIATCFTLIYRIANRNKYSLYRVYTTYRSSRYTG